MACRQGGARETDRGLGPGRLSWQHSLTSLATHREEGTWYGGQRHLSKYCSPALPAIRPEGKNNRLFVFSISMVSVAHWSLDVAADSQEELQDWVKKIREVAQTADARVRGICGTQGCRWAACEPVGGDACSARPASGPGPGGNSAHTAGRAARSRRRGR